MNYKYHPIRKRDSKGLVYLIGSWLLLVIGWLGFGVLTFPLGLYLADASTEHGGDARIVYNLHKWSFFIFMVPLLFILAMGIFWAMIAFSTSVWSFVQEAV